MKVDLLKGTASGGFAEGDTLVSIENVTGSDEASKRDTLYGGNQKNILTGLAGNDILEGDGGGDTIDGGRVRLCPLYPVEFGRSYQS